MLSVLNFLLLSIIIILFFINLQKFHKIFKLCLRLKTYLFKKVIAPLVLRLWLFCKNKSNEFIKSQLVSFSIKDINILSNFNADNKTIFITRVPRNIRCIILLVWKGIVSAKILETNSCFILLLCFVKWGLN